MTMLEVTRLSKHYALGGSIAFGARRRGPVLRAVDDVSLSIERGEVLGLVGESGSGKSTLGRLILNLIPPTSGKVLFEGEDLYAARSARMRQLRQQMQVIFQDPYASLNPRMTVADTLIEGLRQIGVKNHKEQWEQASELLREVGVNPAYLERYPHMFSGGQRQRVALARALSVRPAFIVADEPVSALDLSVQAQVLNLLADIRERHGLTYLFISHDLHVVRYLSDRVAVMHLGKLVESAPAGALFAHPLHPYTGALMDAAPKMDPSRRRSRALVVRGEIQLGAGRASGCAYHPRCPLARGICTAKEPQWIEVRPKHWVACHVVIAESGVGSRPSAVEPTEAGVPRPMR